MAPRQDERSQQQCVVHSFDVTFIGKLEQEFNDFKDRCRHDVVFKEFVAVEKNTFNEAWGWLYSQFPKLVTFFGATVSVYPGTSTVESDFSLIGFEKDD